VIPQDMQSQWLRYPEAEVYVFADYTRPRDMGETTRTTREPEFNPVRSVSHFVLFVKALGRLCYLQLCDQLVNAI
jgi:hypothetical protein